jgi:hypothetical protein
MDRLAEALRRKYGTAADALRAIGIDPDIVERRKGNMAHYRQARRFGRDEIDEGFRRELRDMTDDPNIDFGDLLAFIIENAPDEKQPEIYTALGELGEDVRRGRGHRSWAADRLERRRYARDRVARGGRDDPPEFPGRPRPGGEIDPAGATDRRPVAADMAFDSRSRSRLFDRLFPNAARIEQF